MREWTGRRGVELAAHGKTTTSPALWHRQIAAGAWAITVATPCQLRVAIANGIKRIMHAGAVVDPHDLADLGMLLNTYPRLDIVL